MNKNILVLAQSGICKDNWIFIVPMDELDDKNELHLKWKNAINGTDNGNYSLESWNFDYKSNDKIAYIPTINFELDNNFKQAVFHGFVRLFVDE